MAKTEKEILESIKNGTYTIKDGEEFINEQRRILGIKETAVRYFFNPNNGYLKKFDTTKPFNGNFRGGVLSWD